MSNKLYTYKPSDYTDVGQARILADKCMKKMRYSPGLGFLVYNGSFWEADEQKARLVVQELTSNQLAEANELIFSMQTEMDTSGISGKIKRLGKARAEIEMDEAQAEIYRRYKEAEEYRKFVLDRRDSRKIEATLKQVQPLIEVNARYLDSDPYLLNTPFSTIDLRDGIMGEQDHSSEDLITKQTKVVPSDEGMDLWQDALDKFFCNNSSLINYVQKIVGMAAIGKVCVESIIIAYGDGKNGKSTFWNTIAKVLGSYSGSLSSDILTANCRRNARADIAEIKGKRLLIAAELDEGLRFNTGMIKQLCSTDSITAEKKYQAPFDFEPTHTLVLYTNHLPKTGSRDKGTWRRIIIIPFLATISDTTDIKNYTEYLVNNAGGAVLQWIVEGARMAIDENFKIEQPEIVKEAVDEYREENDWLGQFITNCCDIDEQYTARSGELYNIYRSYCVAANDFVRSSAEFSAALVSAGYVKHKTKAGILIKGLRLKPGA